MDLLQHELNNRAEMVRGLVCRYLRDKPPYAEAVVQCAWCGQRTRLEGLDVTFRNEDLVHLDGSFTVPEGWEIYDPLDAPKVLVCQPCADRLRYVAQPLNDGTITTLSADLDDAMMRHVRDEREG